MSMLPPIVAAVMVKADQVYTELGKVQSEFATTALKTGESSAAMGKSFTAASKAVTFGVIGAAAVVGGVSLKMASDFQSHMTLLQTAGGEQAKNMGVVSSGILNLAGATGTSIEQLSEGMYTIEKAGIRGADGIKVLKAAAEGAKSENVDLGTATNALTSVMMSYHLKAKDAVSVQNEMIAGAGMAKTSMSNYAGSLSTVIPVASAAGINFAQVAGAIATLTQHGTSAEESTQELSNTIRSLQAPNMVAQKAMQQLGLSVTDVSSGLGKRGLTGTIDVISQAIASKMGPSGLVVMDTMKKSQAAAADAKIELAKLPASVQDVAKGFLNGTVTQKEWRKELSGMTVDQRQLASQFAGTVNQSRGFNDLLKSGSPAAQTFAGTLSKVMGGATGMNTALMLGGDNMAYFKKATEDVSNAAKKGGSDVSTWAQTQKNFNVQMAQVKEGVSAFAVKIGTALLPIVQQAVKTIQEWASYLDKNRGVLYAILGVVGAVVGGMMAYYVITKTITAATVAYNVVAGLFGIATKAGAAASYGQAGATYANVAAQKAYVVGAALARVATLAWAGVQTALNAVMSANPVALIILAIIALIAVIVLVVTHWKQVTSFLGTAWNAVGSFFKTVGNGIASWWNGFWKGLVGVVSTVVGAVVGFVKAHWGLLLSFIIGPLGLVIQWVVEHWSQITKVITDVWNKVVGVFQAIGGVLGKIVQVIFGVIVGLAVLAFRPIIQYLVGTWNKVVAQFRAVGDALAAWWGAIWTGVSGVLTAIFKPIIDWLVYVWNTDMATFRAIGDTLSTWWSNIWTTIVAVVTAIFQPVVDWLVGAWTRVHAGFVVIGAVLSGWWNGFWGALSTIVSAIWGRVTGIISTVWNNVTGIFRTAGDVISGIWNGMWTGLGGVVRSAFNGVSSFIRGAMNDVIGVINGAIDGINGLTSIAASVGVHVPKIGHIPSLDVGGWVPGGAGQPTLALNHGGEYMLSVDMLAGRKPVAPSVASALAQNQAAFGGAAAAAPSRGGGQPSVVVMAQTNATAAHIGSEVGWWLRRNG